MICGSGQPTAPSRSTFNWRVVSAYQAIEGEPELDQLLGRLVAAGARTALPVVVAPGRPLLFRAWTPGERLERGIRGIAVPRPDAETLVPDILIVPVVGFDALPITGLLMFLIGVVIAYQGAEQLRKFGTNIFIVDLVGISLLREIAPLIVAILIAGRSGSAYAAEIGTMRSRKNWTRCGHWASRL